MPEGRKNCSVCNKQRKQLMEKYSIRHHKKSWMTSLCKKTLLVHFSETSGASLACRTARFQNGGLLDCHKKFVYIICRWRKFGQVYVWWIDFLKRTLQLIRQTRQTKVMLNFSRLWYMIRVVVGHTPPSQNINNKTTYYYWKSVASKILNLKFLQ